MLRLYFILFLCVVGALAPENSVYAHPVKIKVMRTARSCVRKTFRRNVDDAVLKAQQAADNAQKEMRRMYNEQIKFFHEQQKTQNQKRNEMRRSASERAKQIDRVKRSKRLAEWERLKKQRDELIRRLLDACDSIQFTSDAEHHQVPNLRMPHAFDLL